MIISLKHNRGFEWCKIGRNYFKGYFYFNDNIYMNEEMGSLFKELNSFDTFKELIKKINGCFAIIIDNGRTVWAATDKARSIPLFYSSDGTIISDDTEEIISFKNFNEKDLDPISVSELVLSSYINGENTAYSEIKQLDLGQIAEFSNGKKSEYYYRHLQNGERKLDVGLSSQEFRSVSNRIFDRLITGLQGRPVILPLSGGYDSRYIAAMLKKKKYKNVICYTYGNVGDYEVEYSEKVASSLGFEWHFVEYTNELWESIFQEEFLNYCNYYHDNCSIPHIQDFLALKELKKRGVLPEDGVIVTGFCGDLPAGSFVLSPEDDKEVKYDKEWISSYVFNDHYNHFNSSVNQKREIGKRISNYFEKRRVECFDDFMNFYEEWFTGARPSKWVVNSNRLYEYFGFEWRMPLWDDELLEFWYGVDNKQRYDCKLYKQELFEWLFIPLNIDFQKPEYIRSLSIEYKNSIKRKLKLKILKVITFTFIKTGKNLWKRDNVNNYSRIALLLYKKIENKKICGFEKINAHQMMALWWSEKKYGYKYIDRVFKG